MWLELLDVPGAKAGKINRALAATTEEFVLVLDPDHMPFPEFLDRVMGHFDDDRVGFVQVSQAYYNQRRSFTAAGAAEQTYAFYGPGQMGLYGHGACVAIGANCTFRRSALDVNRRSRHRPRRRSRDGDSDSRGRVEIRLRTRGREPRTRSRGPRFVLSAATEVGARRLRGRVQRVAALSTDACDGGSVCRISRSAPTTCSV